jgi:hypothetical protein
MEHTGRTGLMGEEAPIPDGEHLQEPLYGEPLRESVRLIEG